MKLLSIGILCSAFAVPFAAPTIVAGHAPPIVHADVTEVIDGVIRSVDRDNDTFVIAADDQETTISVDEQTEFFLDGVETRKERALREGHQATITHRDRTASRVEARSQES